MTRKAIGPMAHGDGTNSMSRNKTPRLNVRQQAPNEVHAVKNTSYLSLLPFFLKYCY